MVDISGFKLEIGDVIACTAIGYFNLEIRTIVAFTPKKIQVSIKRNSFKEKEYRFPDQVAFISRPT